MEFKYVKNGDYYIPNIELSSDNKNVNLGKYGRAREKYLRENKPSYFQHLVMTEQITSHLASIENEAKEYEELLIEQIAKQESLNEKLKTENQIEWIQKMNNIKNRVEEIVLNELIFI